MDPSERTFLHMDKRLRQAVLLGASGFVLVSASPAAHPFGQGVMCLGTFIYFAERTGAVCNVGQDLEFQKRIQGYSHRFNDYIVRNAPGGREALTRFKVHQEITSNDQKLLCEGDAKQMYEFLKNTPIEELDSAVDKLLAKDGPPEFGDCV